MVIEGILVQRSSKVQHRLWRVLTLTATSSYISNILLNCRIGSRDDFESVLPFSWLQVQQGSSIAAVTFRSRKKPNMGEMWFLEW